MKPSVLAAMPKRIPRPPPAALQLGRSGTSTSRWIAARDRPYHVFETSTCVPSHRRMQSTSALPRAPPPRPMYTPFTPSSSTKELHPQPLPRSINPSSALLLLTIPHPPSSWPAKLDFASPLLGLASRALKAKGVVVNAVWDGIGSSAEFDLPEEGEEVYPARLYWPDGTSHAFDKFSKGTIMSREMKELLGRKVDKDKALSPGDRQTSVAGQQWEVLVCTHGTRDCRCGDTGGEVVRALRADIEKRGLQEKVSVREVAHVGGHKYAANAIVLHSLDMMSNLTSEHVPHFLSWIIDGRDKADDMWQHWRGRYGLSEVEQAGVWGGVAWAHGEEKRAEDKAVKAGSVTQTSAAEKVGLSFKTYEGEVREVRAGVGETLLEVGKREGLPAIEGVCGGKLECATCHVYIPSSAPIPEPSEEELDMLGYALAYRDGESRLGCQIKVTKELAKWAAKSGQEGVIGLPRF